MGLFSGHAVPYHASAAGKNVVCLHCGAKEFWQRRAKLNSAASEFFDVGWASEESLVLPCTTCGFMSEFMPRGVHLTKVDGA